MTYRLEGFVNGTSPMSASFLNIECLVLNPLFSTWVQYGSLAKIWIYSLVSSGLNAIPAEYLSMRE